MSPRLTQTLRIALSALLILWGGYSLIVYLGQAVHMQVLVSDETRALIQQSCPDGGFCAGWRALFPFLGFTFTRFAPFYAYVFISFLVLLAFMVREYLRSERWEIRLTLAPWKILALFVGSLWLVFTCLSFGGDGNQPFKRLFEPLPQVYIEAGPEAMAALQDNFKALQDRGCLSYVGQTDHNAGVYDYRFFCMQTSFVTRVLSQVVFILFLIFDFLVLGRLLLTLMRARPANAVLEATMSLGMGVSGLIALLWLLSLTGLYTASAGWLLLLAIPVAGWMHALHWLQSLTRRTWTVETSWHAASVILAWLLITYLAFNFLNVIRPFPIGWDDLGRYLNQPRLLVSYGKFIPTMAAFQWEYLTSLGFLLFGYDSTFGATAAMLINWSAGLFAVVAVYAFGHTFLGKGRGILSALVYYTLPMVGHFSFADMKVDNGVFFVGALSVLAAFLCVFPMHDEEEDAPAWDWRWLVLAGMFGGVSFALKPTSVMVIMGILTLLAGTGLGWLGFLGMFTLAWGVFALQGTLNVTDILGRLGLPLDLIARPTLTAILPIVGLTLLAAALYRRRKANALPVLRSTGIFVAALVASVLPWLMYNNLQYGHILPTTVRFTTPNTLSPSFSYGGEKVADIGQPIRTLPPELDISRDTDACRSTSKSEELDRYWGFGKGWGHYLTLPWRVVMNSDAAGYYVTLVPALLLFPLLLLLPYVWSRKGRWALWLSIVTGFILLQWIVFANGIPWYGLGMFLGLAIGMEVLVAKAPDAVSKWSAGILVGLSLLIALNMRMWQYDQQSNLLEYALGKVSAETMRERTIPQYDDMRDIIMERFETMPDRPYAYRIGTFIPYFIPKNLEVLPVADHQLDMFNCLYQEQNPTLTLQRLKALGFNSLIFDTNTQTIEKDPNGSLHKKVQKLLDFLNDPSLGLQVIVNDPDAGVAFVLFP